MSGVIADPKNIRDFQRQLIQFNRELEMLSRKLKSNLRTLNDGWKDSEFHKFEAQMNEVLSAINRHMQDSNEYVRYLDKKAEPLERFLGRGGGL